MIACNNKDEKAKTADIPQSALTQSKNNEAFNKSFDNLLSRYAALKEGFVKEDTNLVATNAKALMQAADSLQLKELKAEAALIETAQVNAKNLSDEAKGLLGEAGIENKRKSFQMITSDLYDLIRVVKYDQAVIYLTHCPMAFDNQGADWLSTTSEIVNPYLPKKMIDCVEIKDSVDFRVKK
jgi:HPt (histidine-containing phosphotransfer) domain-containing protein